jgi:hypothetical protein
MRLWVRDTLGIAFGAAIGYYADITCVIHGESMLPTLTPGERIIVAPAWLRFALCGMEREALLNKIVTVKVDDSEVVCKRVVDASPRFDQLNAYGTDHYYSDSRATPLTSESGNEVTGEADWEVSVPQRRMIWDACIDKHLLTSKL